MSMEKSSLTPLSSSSNNFSSDQHKSQDDAVNEDALLFFGEKMQLTDSDCALLLVSIITHSLPKGILQAEYKNNKKAFNLIRAHPELRSALKKAWKTKDYKEIRESKLLTVKNPNKNLPVEEKNAAENTWTGDYRGKAPELLWSRIQNAMTEEDPYASYLAIVQSSGTGKSRMIEELSKTHLVIPVNLRGPNEAGYPPSDSQACTYLSGMTSQVEAHDHAVAFLKAVFLETSKLILELITQLRNQHSDPSHDKIVKSFREYMSAGMSCESHGYNRQSFYNGVVSCAMELEGDIKQTFATNSDQMASVGIYEAFTKLIEALPSSPHHPLVILAFDDAHTLTQSPNQSWSHFSEFCRALRALNNQSLFSLFLTTAGNINVLPFHASLTHVSSSMKDPSARIQQEASSASRSFTEVGFDHFAIKDQFNLQIVTGDKHISHFGRPLWATRYEEGDDSVKSGIIKFAALKLRAGRANWPREPLNATEKLACLAQRLPIEFHSVTYASKMDEIRLVEGHMRILLRLEAGFESLNTVSSSEPLLSEAAYWMMYADTTFNAAEALKSCLDGYSINKGDRGELLVMLLFILARDGAIGQPNTYGQPQRRWCFVPEFMEALFKSEQLLKVLPSDDPLKALYTDGKVFFNHWIKVHQYTIMNVQYLAHLMRRGAALVCANHPAIDGIIPFLLEGYTIFPDNVGVILWQVTNDSEFTHKPVPSLFEAMDPYALGILNPGDKIPIIRIVFALASRTPCLTRVPCQQDSCDFWVGGISPEVFLPVGDNKDIWTALVQATNGWEDIQEKNPGRNADEVGVSEEGLRRSMNPGTADSNEMDESMDQD